MPLNARQQRFVAEYAIDMNATQAAIRAGYSEKRAAVTGSELLKQPEILTALAEVHRKVAVRVQERIQAPAVASAAWIVQQAVEVVGEARAAEQYSAANGALALLAKRYPEFSEKHEFSGDVRLRVEALAAIATMTPEQLREVASGARTD